MSEVLILEALQRAALAAVANSTLPDTPVRTVGRSEEAAIDGKLIEFIHIPNDRADDYYDETMVSQGIFRMIVHWPIDDQGAYPPLTYVSELAAQFSKNAPLFSGGLRVQIYQNPRVSGPIEDKTELLFTVTLMYRCFQT